MDPNGYFFLLAPVAHVVLSRAESVQRPVTKCCRRTENRTERTGTRRRASILLQAIAVSTVARIRLRCCVQLSSAVVERAFSQPDVSRFRAEADENSDHLLPSLRQLRRAPLCTGFVVHSLADSSLKRRIIGSQQIAELIGHAGNVARMLGGDNSFRCAGMTPQAPWTQICIRKLAIPRVSAVLPNAQNGRTGSDSSAAMTLVTRRPMRWASAGIPYVANHGAGIIDQCDGGDGGVVEAVLHAPDALRMKDDRREGCAAREDLRMPEELERTGPDRSARTLGRPRQRSAVDQPPERERRQGGQRGRESYRACHVG